MKGKQCALSFLLTKYKLGRISLNKATYLSLLLYQVLYMLSTTVQLCFVITVIVIYVWTERLELKDCLVKNTSCS